MTQTKRSLRLPTSLLSDKNDSTCLTQKSITQSAFPWMHNQWKWHRFSHVVVAQKTCREMLLQALLQHPIRSFVLLHLWVVSHYHLLRYLPNWLATLLFTIYILWAPFQLTTDHIGIRFIVVAYHGAVLCRVWALLAVDKSKYLEWSLYDHGEWFFLFDTKKDRDIKFDKWRKRLEKNPNDESAFIHLDSYIPYEQLTFSYFMKAIAKSVVIIILFVLNANYMNTRKDWQPKDFAFSHYPTLDDSMMYILLAAELLLFLEIFVHIYSVYALVFRGPSIKGMRNPYLSRSVGDFWSNRWNTIVQLELRRGIFDPFASLFKKRSVWSMLIPAVLTFFVSGLLHEWGIAVMFQKEPGHCELLHCGWSMTWFFVASGLLMMVERAIFEIVYRATGFHFERHAPRIIQIPYFVAAFLWIVPLILNNLTKYGIHHRIKIW
ncbi:hypothetical protein EDD86DRAFT_203279 [Gorgonomyces haynaldii]|nr:hypothetical protein EDD86DRAFT_203279 [Gorgonomyces haynaldii]